MSLVALALHVLGFLLPALAVALCTTLAARWRAASARRRRWWADWLMCSTAGVAALAASLALSGHDGRMLGYAALVLACGSASWLLGLRPSRR